MAITQTRPKRKLTGGRYRAYRKKRVFEMGSLPSYTKLGKKTLRLTRGVGNNRKRALLSVETANVYIPKEKKYEQMKIETILENPANRHFVRRNIMTKGTIIKTDKGKARITNRPGQEGIVNAVLLG
ncbi:30S ribosomal protein S8e [Candidatus Woesearchaeota archaeon]|nr:30S ribosomal protein S8e [Candidatus Woesearchaeota archaeon]